MNILLLYGGQSYEHDISIQSAHFIRTQLHELRHTIYSVMVQKTGAWTLISISDKNFDSHPEPSPPKNTNDPLTQVWTLPSQGIWHNIASPEKLPIDCVFIMIHGYGGEDGHIQSMLELADVPYTGSNAYASMISMNKHLTKSLCTYYELPVLPMTVVNRTQYMHDHTSALAPYQSKENFPVIVKPSDGGSSIGIYTAHNTNELESHISQCLQYTDTAIIEPLLHPIREIETAIVQQDNTILSFPPGEIFIPSKAVYDYNLKYHARSQDVQLIVPANLDSAIAERIIALSRQVFTLLECEGFARIDFFLTEDNTIYVNEINTIPGFTPFSMFPKIANQTLSHTALIQTIIDTAIYVHEHKTIPFKDTQ